LVRGALDIGKNELDDASEVSDVIGGNAFISENASFTSMLGSL
jgi:hypothetical protein